MNRQPLEFFNRYAGRIETEDVYGLRFLRWTYGNPLGRMALHALVKRAVFSRWYGRRMDSPASRRKIEPFITRYGVNREEMLEDPGSFRTFNEFFHRKLKPGARPVDPRPEVAVFPADGRHMGWPDLAAVGGMFVKGQVFSLEALLGDPRLAEEYQHGAVVISRLCPVDYHRFHFPVAGVADRPRLINGALFSVNPLALRRNIHIFSENRRAVGRIESREFGHVLMLEIGATCVGRVEYTFTVGQPVAKGAEKGFFKFGGSSTITIFPPGRIALAEDLVAHSQNGRELYARVGDVMGTALNISSGQRPKL